MSYFKIEKINNFYKKIQFKKLNQAENYPFPRRFMPDVTIMV